MRMLGLTRTWIHLGGELLIVVAGCWGLYLRFALNSSPLLTTQWFGPLALLALGLLLVVLPLMPMRSAAWIHDWARPQHGISSLLWSFAVCGCLYSLWLQYELQFSLRPVLLLLPAFIYWFAFTCPGRIIQQRNMDRYEARRAEAPAENDNTAVEEVHHA